MKRFSLLISILCATLCWSCQSETSFLVDHASIQNNLHSRGLVTETSLPQGASALFNATGGLVLTNEVFTYNGSFWSNGTALEYTPSSPDIYLTALYPVLENQIYSTETLYSNGELEDMLIAKDTLTSSSKASLNFQHLFSLLTIHVDEKIQRTLQEIRLKTPQKVSQITPKTGDFRLADESHTTIQSYRTDSTYPFILPPMENQVLEITIRTNAEEEYVQRLEPYTFQSGYKYECHLVSADERPGIRTAEDFIAFSQLIRSNSITTYNGKTLKNFGVTNSDGITTYYLLNDLDFKDIDCSKLKQIGYYSTENTRFKDVFDGQGHTLYNLTPITEYGTTGLFGAIGASGIVKNLHLKSCNIKLLDTYKSITGAGMIAGVSHGIINNCSIENCNIDTSKQAIPTGTGGIVGTLRGGTIINSYAKDITISCQSNAGCITGESYGEIINCFSTNCEITSSGDNTGISGISGKSISKPTKIYNCYTHQLTLKNKPRGLFIGIALNSTIKYCFYEENQIYNFIGENKGGNTTNTISFNETTLLHDLLNEWISENQINYEDFTFIQWKQADDDTPATFQ